MIARVTIAIVLLTVVVAFPPASNPNIYIATNLDEPQNLGYCIDIAGHGANINCGSTQSHSCKAKGADTQFVYASGAIKAVNYDGACRSTGGDASKGGCLEASGLTAGAKFRVTSCVAGEAKQSFTSVPARSLLRLGAPSDDLCMVVGSTSRAAGPFMARDLMVGSCTSTPAEFSSWALVGAVMPSGELDAGAGSNAVPPTAGEEVCFVGYVMDRYCIERGTLLDNPSVKTLEAPERHSIHCLVDVAPCYNSEFEVLGDPATGSRGYSRAYTLDKKGHNMALELARATGKKGGCSTCTGSGTQEAGFRATIRGKLTGSGTPPEVAVLEVLPATVGCAGGATGGCASTQHGCCDDGITAASTADKAGCPPPVGGCSGTQHGCCADGQTSASGPNNAGCGLMGGTDVSAAPRRGGGGMLVALAAVMAVFA